MMCTFESLKSNSNEMIISTNLKGDVAKNILLNVLGQLSDGIWENSRVAEHYWPFVDITTDEDQSVYIIVHKPGSKHVYRNNSTFENWFLRHDKLGSDKTSIKEWFAKKIKQVVAHERKDNPARNLKFKADNDTEMDYMSSYDKEDDYRPLKISEAYSVYKALKD